MEEAVRNDDVGALASSWAATKNTDLGKRTTSMLVPKCKSKAVLEFLITECKADVNSCDNNGWSLLHHVCHTGNLELFTLLIRMVETDAEALTKDGKGPLALAEEAGQQEIVDYVQKRVDSNQTAIEDLFFTLVTTAIKEDSIENVESVAQNNPVFFEDFRKTRGGDLLSIVESVSMAKYLVEVHGISPGSQCSSGAETAFTAACKRTQVLPVLVYFVSKAPGLVFTRSPMNLLPVEVAAINGNLEGMRVLKKYLAPPSPPALWFLWLFASGLAIMCILQLRLFPSSTALVLGLFALGLVSALGGVLQIMYSRFYKLMVPSYYPMPHVCVYMSGLSEVACSILCFVPGMRNYVAIALVLLLISRFPASFRCLSSRRLQRNLGMGFVPACLQLIAQGATIVWASSLLDGNFLDDLQRFDIETQIRNIEAMWNYVLLKYG